MLMILGGVICRRLENIISLQNGHEGVLKIILHRNIEEKNLDGNDFFFLTSILRFCFKHFEIFWDFQILRFFSQNLRNFSDFQFFFKNFNIFEIFRFQIFSEFRDFQIFYYFRNFRFFSQINLKTRGNMFYKIEEIRLRILRIS